MVKKNKNNPSIIFENKGLEVSNLGKRIKNRPILRGINLNVNFLNILFIFCLLWDESLILEFYSYSEWGL